MACRGLWLVAVPVRRLQCKEVLAQILVECVGKKLLTDSGALPD